jgi:hypothetical protein
VPRIDTALGNSQESGRTEPHQLLRVDTLWFKKFRTLPIEISPGSKGVRRKSRSNSAILETEDAAGHYRFRTMGSLIKKRRKRMRKKKHKKMLKRTRFQRRAKKK